MDEGSTALERIRKMVRERYHVEPEHPWPRFPEYEVYRHEDNRKWFGILMLVSAEKRRILNVRISDPVQRDILLQQDGIFPAYHMNKRNWLSVLIDRVPAETTENFLAQSYFETASAKTKAELRGPREWLIPSNVAYCDPRHFFDDTDTVSWTQSSSVRPGDTVYIYAGVPIGAILYRCRAVETDLPAEADLRRSFRSGREMILKLERRFDESAFTREILREDFGIKNVRGPRYVPHDLSRALNGRES